MRIQWIGHGWTKWWGLNRCGDGHLVLDLGPIAVHLGRAA